MTTNRVVYSYIVR